MRARAQVVCAAAAGVAYFSENTTCAISTNEFLIIYNIHRRSLNIYAAASHPYYMKLAHSLLFAPSQKESFGRRTHDSPRRAAREIGYGK